MPEFTLDPTPMTYKWLKSAAKLSDRARRWLLENFEEAFGKLGFDVSEDELARERYILENGNAETLLKELFGPERRKAFEAAN